MADIRQHHVDEEDEAIARYLLGLSTDEERAAIQERLFEDEDYFDRIIAAEYELLDAYSRGEMPASERALMESSLLASEAGRRKLEFSRALAASQKRPAKQHPPYLLIAAAVVAATVVGLLLTSRTNHNAIETRANPAVTAPQAQRAKPPVVFSILLTPGTTRGGAQIKRLEIPAGTHLVQLQLDLEGDSHRAFDATLKTTAGTEVWEQTGFVPQPDGSVLCRIPASLLKSGSYELTLSATPGESAGIVAYYYFRIS
jgi:hypothetical protein